MISLEAKFCNDTGFNYIAFLEELQPQAPQDFMYEKRLEEIRKTNQRKSLPELNAQKDLEGVLLKVKTKVCTAFLFCINGFSAFVYARGSISWTVLDVIFLLKVK